MSSEKGRLYLVPVFLSDDSLPDEVFPPANAALLKNIRHFIVEHEKQARRFLKKTVPEIPQNDLHFFILNKHTPPESIGDFLSPLSQGHPMALLSDAGMPAIADPGARVVRLAHEKGIEVVPLVGPSSLFLALAASGMNGQQFEFHGYLPVESGALKNKIKELTRDIRQTGKTHIFIETPYRNNKLLDSLIKHLPPDIRLCVAVNLTSPEQILRCKTVKRWRNDSYRPGKKPAVFIIGR